MTAQEASQRAQEGPERDPRGAREGDPKFKNLNFRPERAPGGSKRAQRGPKRLRRGPKDAPKRPQKDPKRLQTGSPRGFKPAAQKTRETYHGGGMGRRP